MPPQSHSEKGLLMTALRVDWYCAVTQSDWYSENISSDWCVGVTIRALNRPDMKMEGSQTLTGKSVHIQA